MNIIKKVIAKSSASSVFESSLEYFEYESSPESISKIFEPIQPSIVLTRPTKLTVDIDPSEILVKHIFLKEYTSEIQSFRITNPSENIYEPFLRQLDLLLTEIEKYEEETTLKLLLEGSSGRFNSFLKNTIEIEKYLLRLKNPSKKRAEMRDEILGVINKHKELLDRLSAICLLSGFQI